MWVRYTREFSPLLHSLSLSLSSSLILWRGNNSWRALTTSTELCLQNHFLNKFLFFVDYWICVHVLVTCHCNKVPERDNLREEGSVSACVWGLSPSWSEKVWQVTKAGGIKAPHLILIEKAVESMGWNREGYSGPSCPSVTHFIQLGPTPC